MKTKTDPTNGKVTVILNANERKTLANAADVCQQYAWYTGSEPVVEMAGELRNLLAENQNEEVDDE